LIYKRDFYFYHSTNYKPGKKTNDSVVKLISNECAEIITVFIIEDEYYIDVRKMITENVFHVSHIFKVSDKARIRVYQRNQR